jgi:hypothetical protein
MSVSVFRWTVIASVCPTSVMKRVSKESRHIGVCVLNEPEWQHSLTESETGVMTSYVTSLKRCHVISARISQTSWNIITSSVMYDLTLWAMLAQSVYCQCYGLLDWAVGGRFSENVITFLSSPQRPDWFWGPPNLSNGYRLLFSWGCSSRESDHSFQFIAQVKNAWSCIFTPSFIVMWCGVKRRDNFRFNLERRSGRAELRRRR